MKWLNRRSRSSRSGLAITLRHDRRMLAGERVIGNQPAAASADFLPGRGRAEHDRGVDALASLRVTDPGHGCPEHGRVLADHVLGLDVVTFSPPEVITSLPRSASAHPMAAAATSRRYGQVRHLAAQQAGRRSRPRLVLSVAGGGPDDHGRPGSPGPGHAAPPVLLGEQVIGVSLDEQLSEHRVHRGLLAVPGLRNDQLRPACPARGVAVRHRADTAAVSSRTPMTWQAAGHRRQLDGYELRQS
jgi:hypothetical protein